MDDPILEKRLKNMFESRAGELSDESVTTHPPRSVSARGMCCYYCAQPMTTRTRTSVPGAAGGSTFPVMGVPSTAMEAIPFSTW